MNKLVVIDGVKYVPEGEGCAGYGDTDDYDENWDELDADEDAGTGCEDADGEEIKVGGFVKVRLSYLTDVDNGGVIPEEERYGRVLSVNDGITAVEFPKYKAHRHDCDGKTKVGHGWYFANNRLRIIR